MNTVKEIEASAKQRMDKALEDLQHSMAAIRTGRASVHLLDNVRVDYYGTPTPVNQVGNLHVPEPGMITITPWDTSQIAPIEKATPRRRSGNADPSNDGKMRIRIPIPPLTEERRKEIRQEAARGSGGSSRGCPQHSPRFERQRQEAFEGKEDQRGRRSARAR